MDLERIKLPFPISRMIAGESVRSFLRNNDFEMSAALATYGFFALIPLFFFLAYLFGNHLFFSDVMLRGVENLMGHLFPHMDQFVTKGSSFITGHKTTWGAVTLVLIFVSIMSLVDTMKTAFQKILNVDSEISFIQSQLKNIHFSFIMLVLFFVLIVAEIFYSFLTAGLPGVNASVTTAVFILTSLAIATTCMMVFYITFLPLRLNWTRFFAASFVSAVLIVFMREIFSAFLASTPGYGQTFGPLKTLFVMIIWVYYCFLVILFGAEITVNFSKKDALLLKGLFTRGASGGTTPKTLIKKFITKYDQGDTVFSEGEKGDDMFCVVSGSVHICRNRQVIRTIEKGEYAGEMSMLLNSPRTATIIAAESDTELIRISQGNFDVILSENPKIVLAILKEIALRLKITDESL